jgi:hypothetical protein
VKLFGIRGIAFIKAIILAGKKFWHVLLLRKQVNCSLPGTISTSLIITLKLFHSFVQIPDHDPDGRDECKEFNKEPPVEPDGSSGLV